MSTLEEIIDCNYCGIGEDKGQVLEAVKEWLTSQKSFIEGSQIDCLIDLLLEKIVLRNETKEEKP